MAILHFVNYAKPQNKAGMRFVLRYVMQEKKTVSDGNKLVTGVNCSADCAYSQFRNTKLMHRKNDGRQFYHLVQSFPVGEAVPPETAHEIALRFAAESEKLFGYEIVVATHCDRDHIHSHLVFNSVNAETGKKFHITTPEIEKLMQLSDSIIQEYGFSIYEPQKKKTVSHMGDREYRTAEKGDSWKMQLIVQIEDAMRYAVSHEHFIELMEAEGILVRWTDTRKNITYTMPNGKKCSDDKLHEEKFSKGNMEYEFRIRAEITAGAAGNRKTKYADSRDGDTLRYSDRAELEGLDNSHADAAYADGKAADSTEHAFDETGAGRIAPTAERDAVSIYTGVGANDRSLSESIGAVGSGSSSRAGQQDAGDAETGWEYEREIFRESVSGRTPIEASVEDILLDIPSPGVYPSSAMADTAYLIADLSRVIDNDHPVQDSTTLQQPRQRKKKEQQSGPVMGGM